MKDERIIIDHNNKAYRRKWAISGGDRYNGAYYYSREIVDNIIPNVDTDRNWVTIHIPNMAADHSIVFIHNNINTGIYEFLKHFDDVILVCGVPETVEKVKHIGKAIYLPLSIDLDYVNTFRVGKYEKTSPVAFVGRKEKKTPEVPEEVPCICDMPRPELLQAVARQKSVYAVGRCAIEAKALGCKILPYDSRYPKVSRWKVLDNLEAAKILQKELDKIDKPNKEEEK